MTKKLATALLAGAMSLAATSVAFAQSEPFIGQVSLFAYNWCPRGWVIAQGQLMSIAANTAMFSLLGTSFGGDGRTTFALPNLAGRSPYGQQNNGQGQPFGAPYGQSSVTLTIAQLPAHTHQLRGSSAAADTYTLNGSLLSTPANTAAKAYAGSGSPADVNMASGAIGVTGSNQPVSTQSPALSMNWCIATQGIFPSRQ